MKKSTGVKVKKIKETRTLGVQVKEKKKRNKKLKSPNNKKIVGLQLNKKRRSLCLQMKEKHRSPSHIIFKGMI